jgi:hypothetical protein
MTPFDLIENGKYIPAFAPLDITGAGVDGDLVSMALCERLFIVLQCGAWAGGTSAVTVTQEASASGSSNTAVAFAKKWEGVALTDDIPAEVAVTSNTFNLDTANEFHVIKILPSMLTDGYTHVRVRCATPGSNADLLAGFYVMSGLKYEGAFPPTAIA